MNKSQKELLNLIVTSSGDDQLVEVMDNSFIINGYQNQELLDRLSGLIGNIRGKDDRKTAEIKNRIAFQVCNKHDYLISLEPDDLDYANITYGYRVPISSLSRPYLGVLANKMGISEHTLKGVFKGDFEDELTMENLAYLSIIRRHLPSIEPFISYFSSEGISNSLLASIIAYSLLFPRESVEKVFTDKLITSEEEFIKVLDTAVNKELRAKYPELLSVSKHYDSIISTAVMIIMNNEGSFRNELMELKKTNKLTLYSLWKHPDSQYLILPRINGRFILQSVIFEDLGQDWIRFVVDCRSFNIDYDTLLKLGLVALTNKSIYKYTQAQLFDFINDPYEMLAYY